MDDIPGRWEWLAGEEENTEEIGFLILHYKGILAISSFNTIFHKTKLFYIKL